MFHDFCRVLQLQHKSRSISELSSASKHLRDFGGIVSQLNYPTEKWKISLRCTSTFRLGFAGVIAATTPPHPSTRLSLCPIHRSEKIRKLSRLSQISSDCTMSYLHYQISDHVTQPTRYSENWLNNVRKPWARASLAMFVINSPSPRNS